MAGFLLEITLNISLASDRCSATGCRNTPVESNHEVREIPAWRHPADLIGKRAFEAVALIHYCSEHKVNALEVNSRVARGKPLAFHTGELVC